MDVALAMVVAIVACWFLYVMPMDAPEWAGEVCGVIAVGAVAFLVLHGMVAA